MEFETLFTTTKWEILSLISKKPHAPLEIAKRLNTTIANVSQQLRLLEAAGLVRKTRVANSEAGKPRAFFRIDRNFANLSIVTNGIAKKEIIDLSDSQIFLSRLWFLDNKTIIDVLSKLYYTKSDQFNSFSNLYYLGVLGNKIVLETLDKKGDDYEISFGKTQYKVQIKSVKEFSKEGVLLK